MRTQLAAVAALGLALAGCGARSNSASLTTPAPTVAPGPALHGHPQAVNPVAGSVSGPGAPAAAGPQGNATAGGVAGVSVGPPPAGLPQPVSDAEIRRELASSGISAQAGRATLTPQGLALPPPDAPAVVQAMIAAGNEIAHLPYRFGGGHGTFSDTAYDCSGSLSFVFASAGILGTTVTSGELMTMGQPGPGRWVTIYANAGHTFMYVAGLRFDTVALAETGTRWSNRPADEPDLSTFVIRHPAGL